VLLVGLPLLGNHGRAGTPSAGPARVSTGSEWQNRWTKCKATPSPLSRSPTDRPVAITRHGVRERRAWRGAGGDVVKGEEATGTGCVCRLGFPALSLVHWILGEALWPSALDKQRGNAWAKATHGAPSPLSLLRTGEDGKDTLRAWIQSDAVGSRRPTPRVCVGSVCLLCVMALGPP